MKSLVLMTATRYLLPLLLLFAVFALFRGHNEPGGGFIGGLVAAAAFALYAIAYSVDEARQALSIHPRALVGIGLLVALVSAFIGMLYGDPFMTGKWDTTEVPSIGKLGTPLLFDVGVFLVVMGITLSIIFALAEEE